MLTVTSSSCSVQGIELDFPHIVALLTHFVEYVAIARFTSLLPNLALAYFCVCATCTLFIKRLRARGSVSVARQLIRDVHLGHRIATPFRKKTRQQHRFRSVLRFRPTLK